MQDPESPSLILVVEDDLLVAADLAAMLVEASFAVLGPVSTVMAALHLLAHQRPDAAVLDVGLRNDLVTPLACDLQAMGVPFLVATGYSRAALLNDNLLSSAPVLEKPIQPSALIDTLAVLLGEAGHASPNTSEAGHYNLHQGTAAFEIEQTLADA
jgi:DNA-binding response OmpR family regulator